ncbi:GNAT family N-acetyltransferase [Agromyces sp. MMS24-K17]|uniref:GNAT family N-acetyltransferase n=1 Tax=Agromyces sp. MMS24-K17 TaxID=3372850 RepID=UPI003754E401
MDQSDDAYVVVEGVPDVETYLALRAAAGMRPRSPEGARIGLPNTWFGVLVRTASGGPIVGMGRIVGDGGCHLQVVDVAVAPEHQGRGLGTRIMTALTDAIRDRAPAEAYVSLIADGDAHRLYARFGFAPTAPASIGMALRA